MTARREQINVPVSERSALIARQLALIEGITVPELLRPTIEGYLSDRLKADDDLRAAVEAAERARGRLRGATVTSLSTTKQHGAKDSPGSDAGA